jgi:hypothetical protein
MRVEIDVSSWWDWTMQVKYFRPNQMVTKLLFFRQNDDFVRFEVGRSGFDRSDSGV